MTIRHAAAILLASFSLAAHASTSEYNTSAATVLPDGPVHASASFAASGDQNYLTVTLHNLLPNPTAIGQVVTGIAFDASGLGSSVSVTSGTLIRISRDEEHGNSWSAASGQPAWYLTKSGNTDTLSIFGHGKPRDGLIGAPDANGKYSAANGSIASNSPHNPFYEQSVTFRLPFAVPKLYTGVDKVQFMFGTTQSLVTAAAVQAVPEPQTYAMLTAGLGVLAFVARRKKPIR